MDAASTKAILIPGKARTARLLPTHCQSDSKERREDLGAKICMELKDYGGSYALLWWSDLGSVTEKDLAGNKYLYTVFRKT